jgi:hypothetical protein
MAKKIYKLCLMRRYTEAYYELSPEKKQQLTDDLYAAVYKTGAKMVTPYYNCRWANDEYDCFFILEYPDIEAAMADTAGVEKIEWFRFSRPVMLEPLRHILRRQSGGCPVRRGQPLQPAQGL